MVAAVAILVAAMTGCATVPVVDTPAGFASFDDVARPTAISPDGVVLSVRTVANEPAQTLEFWAEALERQMVQSGYVLIGRDGFEAFEAPGSYFEWLAPVGDEDWIYLTAIVVQGDQIIIAEAAGRFDLYQARRDSLVAALDTLSVDTAGL